MGPLQVGRYVLHDEIASGGMASVHVGRLVGTGGFAKIVAIKRLHRQFARQDNFRQMILEEGRLAARIRHPNVVPPLDVLAENGELLLVMEYVHGESLSKLIRAMRANGERVQLEVAAAVLSNALHGLHAAHEAKGETGIALNLVHRDVSPQNILVGVDGVARVIDFGIAKAITSGEHTATGTVKGKVPYLAPEQLEGDPATRRTDVYAASVTLWELLAGARLFDGQDDGETLRNIMSMRVKPPSAINPTVPRAIDDVVLRGISRKPDERFATTREMALAIEGAVHLAPASAVGAWTERLAAPALAERAKRVAEVEAVAPGAPVAGVPGQLRTAPMQARSATGTGPTAPPNLAGAKTELPSLFDGDETLAATRAEGAAKRAALLAEVDAQRRGGPPLPAVGPLLTDSAPEGTIAMPGRPRLEDLARAAAQGPPGAPVQAQPMRPPEPSSHWEAAAAPVKTKRSAVPFVLGALVVVVAGAFFAAPAIVRRLVVAGAAKRGVTLTIDRVELSRKSVRLVGVKAESPVEVPGVSLHAAAATIGLTRFSPTTLALDGVEVTAQGDLVAVATGAAMWQSAHGPQVKDAFADYTSVAIGSGHAKWKDFAGAGTSIALDDLTLDAKRTAGRPLGDDYHVGAALTIASGATSAGPWKLDLDRRGAIETAVVHFDASGASGASVTVTRANGGATVSFAVPPTALADLHVPPSIFAPLVTDKTRFAAQGDVTIAAGGAPPAGPSLAGHPLFVATALAPFATGDEPPGTKALLVDAALDLPLAGDPSRPVALDNATLSLTTTDPPAAFATATLSGQLDLANLAKGPSLTLAGRTGSIPCAPKDRSETALAVALEVPLARLPQGKLTFTPTGSCTPRVR